MSGTRRSAPRGFGRLRAPILALVAGVGFVVGAPAEGIAGASGAPDAEVVAADALLESALQAASGLTSLPSLQDGVGKGPRSRTPGASRCELRTPEDSGSGGPAWSPSASSRSGAPASPGARAAAVAARDALGRSGRLSAPSTAPPSLAF